MTNKLRYKIMSIRDSVKRFFPQHLTQQMREFIVASAIFDFGASMSAIFEPIYLWSIGWRLQQIVVFFLVAYVFYFFIAPFGVSYARSRGYEHSIALSTPFLVLYYFSIFAIPRHPIFIALALVSFGLFRTFYWPGARSIIAQYSTDDESGRTLSSMNAVSIAVTLLGPILGGLLIQQFGFAVLFMIVSAIVLLSNVPMLITPEKFEPHDLRYFDAFARMLKPQHRKEAVAHLGYGEELISELLWPVFLVILIPSYIAVGAVVTVGSVLAIIAIIVVGKITDDHHRHPIMHAGVLMTALAWLSRIFTVSPLGAAVSQSLYRVSRTTLSLPFLTIASNKARDYSVMKSSLLYTMSAIVGKILTAVAILVLLAFFPDQWAPIFTLAAVMTFFYGIF